MKEASVGVSFKLKITDDRQFSKAMDIASLQDLTGEVLLGRLFVFTNTYEQTGLSNLSCSDIQWDNDILTFNVTAQVDDFGALIRTARSDYAGCWGDQDWFPSSPEEAFWEAGLASNANPSPSEIGFEIMDMSPIEPSKTPAVDSEIALNL